MGASERLQWTGEWDMSDGGCRSQMLGARRPRDQSGFNQHTAESVCSAFKIVFTTRHLFLFVRSTWNMKHWSRLRQTYGAKPGPRVLFIWEKSFLIEKLHFIFYFELQKNISQTKNCISWEGPEITNDSTMKETKDLKAKNENQI